MRAIEGVLKPETRTDAQRLLIIRGRSTWPFEARTPAVPQRVDHLDRVRTDIRARATTTAKLSLGHVLNGFNHRQAHECSQFQAQASIQQLLSFDPSPESTDLLAHAEVETWIDRRLLYGSG